jgi:hypothetical protein
MLNLKRRKLQNRKNTSVISERMLTKKEGEEFNVLLLLHFDDSIHR